MRRDRRRRLHALRGAELEERTINFDLDLDMNVNVTALLLTYGVSNWHRFRGGGPLRLDLPDRYQPGHHHSVRQWRHAGALLRGHAGGPGVHRQPVRPGGCVGPGGCVHAAEGQPPRGRAGLGGRPRRRPGSPGSEEDLRGSGAVALRGLAILSARFDTFSPHANIGYQYRGAEVDPDVFLLTAGFDQLLAPWATLAADIISEFPVGTTEIPVPQSDRARVAVPARGPHFVHPGPKGRHHRCLVRHEAHDPQAVTFVGNAVFPLNRGGMRADVLWSLGAEYTF